MSTKNGTQPPTTRPTPPAVGKPLTGPVLCRQIKGQDIDPAHIRERTVAIYNAEADGLQRHDSASARCTKYKSHRSCKLSQKLADMPKNFSRRNAVLGVMPRFPLMISLIL